MRGRRFVTVANSLTFLGPSHFWDIGESSMKKFVYAAALAAMTTPALAGVRAVPEMSAGAGVAAIALLVGAAAIIRERMKK